MAVTSTTKARTKATAKPALKAKAHDKARPASRTAKTATKPVSKGTRNPKGAKLPDDDVEDAIAEAVGSKKKTKGGVAGAVLDFAAIYGNTVDAISRKMDFDADLLDDIPPMSTNNLMLDLLLGGGIRPAWYTHYGPEQSCKTTGALQIMAAAIMAMVPIIGFADYEGSTKNSKPYVNSILKANGLKVTAKDVFGRKDQNTGEWLVRPIVRYRSETIGEKFFDWLAEILRSLPDKKFIAGKWWLVFEETKPNLAKYKEHAVASMAKKYGKGLWIEAPDDKLQAVILLDSYPGMNPTANDDEDANNSLALQARMFSKHIPRVKGRMASKMVAVIGMNQLRDIPMAMHGPKEKEPCGQALRYNSDVRIEFRPIWSNLPFNPKFDTDERLEMEKSATHNGKDRYRYVRMKTFKNKLWNPGRKAFVRVWTEDATGEAKGFDPFFDTVHFLKETGQLTGKNKGSIWLKLEGLGEAKKSLSWFELKQWVLGDKATMSAISQKAGFKPMDLRRFCFRQLQKGVAEAAYVAKRQQGKVAEEEEA
jgi:RecA/RadA recombinase